MNTLLENPVPIYAVGAVLITLCGLAFLTRRNLQTLFVLGTVCLLTVLLLITEQLVVTDREEVEAATAELMSALEQNDMPGVLAWIDPAASEVRSDVETLMPLVRVKDTGATSIKVEFDRTTEPPVAMSEFRAKIDGVHARSGARVFYFDRVLVNWTKQNGRWLLTSYTPLDDGRPINAVDSMRSNRPVTR